MENLIKYWPVILSIIAFVIVVLTARHIEKKSWNNGVCPKCGGRYRLFGTDSQGGRGYSCEDCDHTIWISYNVDNYD